MSTQNNLVQANIISSGTNKKVNKCIKFFKEDHAPSSNATSDPEIDLYNAVDKDTPYGFINQNETQECIDKKRNHLLQDDYYSSTINQEKIINMTKLPEYIHFEEEDLNVKVEEIFKELLTQPKDFFLAITKNLNDYMLKEKSGTVGPMCSTKALRNILNKKDSAVEQSFEELEKDIAATRIVLNDGDSFYRSFMFALIEHQIVYANLFDFKKLIYGISTKLRSKIFERKNTDTNLNEILFILYLIYNDVSQGNIKNAYGILITAINQSRSFDYGLIKYMKVALSEYIETNADAIFKDEHFEEIEAIAAPAYLVNHTFDYKGYIKNRVLTMNYDADKFIVQLSPAVFHVNLDLYAIEGTAQEIPHISFLKNCFHCLSDSTTKFSIALFYHFSRFNKLYSKDFLHLYEDSITYIMKEMSDVPRFTVTKPSSMCDTCKVSSEEISFEHIPNFTFCKNCIIEAIDKIITKRISFITKENYNNIGYYVRPISLGNDFDYKLYDEDFIALFNRTIPQQLLYTMDCLCFNCMKPLDKTFNKMPCGCKLCNSCLINFIMEGTDHHIILNEYEKHTSKLKKVKCCCGNPFDLEAGIDMQPKEKIVEYKRQAQERLAKLAEVRCAVCQKIHTKVNESKAVNMNTNTRKDDPIVKFSVNDSTCDFPHIMCQGCVDVYRSEVDKMAKRGECKLDDVYIPIDCKICYKRHNVENRKLRSTKKNTDNACCVIF